jgi:hypothetical protein
MVTAPNLSIYIGVFLFFKILKELNSGCDNFDKIPSIFEVTIVNLFDRHLKIKCIR